jgi:hypothetical protein
VGPAAARENDETRRNITMTTTTDIQITGRNLTLDDRIDGAEVTLVGVTGSAEVHARVARIRNSNLDVLRVMAEQVLIENSNVDSINVETPDWFWGRVDASNVMIRLSHVYVVKLEHAGTVTVDRSWVSRVEAETMREFIGGAAHVDEMWVRWGETAATVDDSAIGRTNLLIADCGVDHSGYRMNLMSEVGSGQLTVSYRGRRMPLRLAREVLEDHPELSRMLSTGLAAIKRKEEIYS